MEHMKNAKVTLLLFLKGSKFAFAGSIKWLDTSALIMLGNMMHEVDACAGYDYWRMAAERCDYQHITAVIMTLGLSFIDSRDYTRGLAYLHRALELGGRESIFREQIEQKIEFVESGQEKQRWESLSEDRRADADAMKFLRDNGGFLGSTCNLDLLLVEGHISPFAGMLASGMMTWLSAQIQLEEDHEDEDMLCELVNDLESALESVGGFVTEHLLSTLSEEMKDCMMQVCDRVLHINAANRSALLLKNALNLENHGAIEHAAKLFPGDPFVLASRSYAGAGSLEDKIKIAKRAVELAPSSPEIWYALLSQERFLGGPLKLNEFVSEKLKTCHSLLSVCPPDHYLRQLEIFLVFVFSFFDQASSVVVHGIYRSREYGSLD